jgi:hypothetical protein
MNVARYWHAVNFDVDDVLIGSDVLGDLAVDVAGDVVCWAVGAYEELCEHLQVVAVHGALLLA